MPSRGYITMCTLKCNTSHGSLEKNRFQKPKAAEEIYQIIPLCTYNQTHLTQYKRYYSKNNTKRKKHKKNTKKIHGFTSTH